MLRRVVLTIPEGAKVRTTRRKGNTSGTVLVTVNAGTELVVERLGGVAPAPVPVPAPAPAPAPVPPPVSASGVVIQPLNPSRILVLGNWISDINRYERHRFLEAHRQAVVSIPLRCMDSAAGGVPAPFGAASYTLLLDGAPVAQTVPPAAFQVDLRAVPEGWHQLDVRGLADDETAPSWFVYVLAGDRAVEQPLMPVVRGTYELAQGNPKEAAHAWVPARFNPTPMPLPRREYPVFADLPHAREFNCTQLAPLRFGDSHRPNINKDGIVSTFDNQSYHFYDMVAKMPNLPSLDGPRGVGNILMTTHVSIGTSAPDGRPTNALYVCDPWRVARVGEDGSIRTLVGYRHRGLPNYWRDPADVELVGDWSAVPVERRGFHELWGMAWDQRTLTVNESAPRIPSEGNLHPHVVGPVMFLADSQNNRIVRVEFSAVSHSTPAKVTEFITGLADPWDVVCEDGMLYVSERKAHRIAVYDATTGAFVRVLCRGQALAGVSASRFVYLSASREAIRAEQCVAPEGIYKLPGDPWLYFGSVAMAQVRRVHVQTGAVEVVCDVPVGDNSLYFKIAVGDGTFGPRGTVFVWSWTNSQYGFPFTYLPEGFTYRNWEGESRVWKWYEERTEVGQWASFNYATAGAVANGRMVCGGACEGLIVVSKRRPGDRLRSEAAARGEQEYRRSGLNLVHGHFGFGYYGLPLPWGHSADVDAFLELHGHAR